MSKPFFAYVVTYNNDQQWSLSELTSVPGLTAVFFAFGNLTGGGADATVDMGPSSFTAVYSQAQIQAAITALHGAGIKAILSINDNGGKGPTHWYDINTAQAAATFAGNVAGIVSSWGFDGVDLDNEDGWGSNSTFNLIVPALRTALGSKWITAPVYGGNQMNVDLGAVAATLNYVQTMNYFDGIPEYITELLQQYPALNGKVMAGVGTPLATGNQQTPLGDIPGLLTDASAAGLCLWAINYSDAPPYVAAITG